jgi:hypothetical protein
MWRYQGGAVASVMIPWGDAALVAPVKGCSVTENDRTALPRLTGLSIEPADESPGNLVLKLGTSRFECILELDDPDFTGNGGHLDAVHTLDCWLSVLEQLSSGGVQVGLLPFNFSDQCTGWLRVGPAHDHVVEVQAGWSRVGQYDLVPSDLTAASNRITDFEPVRNARIRRPLAEIVAAVTAAREVIAGNRDQDGTATDQGQYPKTSGASM